MTVHLQNRVVLVTGVTAGIGRALVSTLADRGASVIGMARRREVGEQLAAEIADAGGKFVFVQGDVGIRADCDAAVAAAVDEFGRLDVLINNAATMFPTERVEAVTESAWDTITRTTMVGTLNMSRAALRVMQEQGDGHIITLSSGVSEQALAGTACYAMSKAANNQLMRVIAVENVGRGVRANTVLIGVVATEMTIDGMVAMGRAVHGPDWVPAPPAGEGQSVAALMLQPDEVARSVAVLCSDDAREITGATIAVDRGFSAGFMNSTAMHLTAAQLMP